MFVDVGYWQQQEQVGGVEVWILGWFVVDIGVGVQVVFYQWWDFGFDVGDQMFERQWVVWEDVVFWWCDVVVD